MKAKDKVIVVTGGGSGIGRELVLQLLKKGARVAATDISEKSLNESAALAGDSASNLSLHAFDISDAEKVYALPDEVIRVHGAVDGIINNAGIIQPFIPVNDLDNGLIEKIFRVNFFGTLHMVKAFLPHLLKRPEGHIINVCSMGGFIPFPGQTIYSASKAAVKMLTEGLHSELRNTNVHITLILPGAVNTNIMENSGVKDGPGSKEGQASKINQADEAARIMIESMEKNRYRVFVGNDSKFLDFLYRLMPTAASNFIAKQMAKMK
jgi:short-subunit dehydrogenase